MIQLKTQIPLSCLYNWASKVSLRMILGRTLVPVQINKAQSRLHVLRLLSTLVNLPQHFEKFLRLPCCPWGALTKE